MGIQRFNPGRIGVAGGATVVVGVDGGEGGDGGATVVVTRGKITLKVRFSQKVLMKCGIDL